MAEKSFNPFERNDLPPSADVPQPTLETLLGDDWTEQLNTRERGRPKIDYPASMSPSVGDIREVAGFYEGEGTIGIVSKQLSAQIGQNDKEKLEWIQLRFGGKIYGPYTGTAGSDVYHWRLVRERALGFMFTIFTFLTASRRKQFRDALDGNPSGRKYQKTVDENGFSQAWINRKMTQHQRKKESEYKKMNFVDKLRRARELRDLRKREDSDD